MIESFALSACCTAATAAWDLAVWAENLVVISKYSTKADFSTETKAGVLSVMVVVASVVDLVTVGSTAAVVAVVEE